ncbi:hypothetical protein AVEN_129897-1 [Araneus ventricosus]|uniref:Uncharacterized protein n=1 Tax=Araneus ventricosus TaxID=182803 RepID=A0A4Y2R037_ARAVE|nr:hypothetical protein AVEN_129897-1 [Araneus ventricosus]
MGDEIKAPPGTIYSTLEPLADKKFNAYINVEVRASVKSVKYLYKYVYEGHDAASVRIQSNDGLLNNDEFLAFLDGRYVSAPEAMWRVNEFSLRKISCNHEVGRSLAKPTASGNKKCSDNATSKFDAFKRPVQRAVPRIPLIPSDNNKPLVLKENNSLHFSEPSNSNRRLNRNMAEEQVSEEGDYRLYPLALLQSCIMQKLLEHVRCRSELLAVDRIAAGGFPSFPLSKTQLRANFL